MHFIAAYKPRLQRDATSARPHHVCSIAFAPHPECPARIAKPRKKSVAAPRAKKKTGSHSDTMPTTAKYVKYTFSIMRSPRMSSCAPIGVARFFRRAMCPSKASSAIVATVSTTAARFAHGPRPNKLTAANPTATRKAVTLFGVHCIATCSNLPGALKEPCLSQGNHLANPAPSKTFACRHLGKAPQTWIRHDVGQTLQLSPSGCRSCGVQFVEIRQSYTEGDPR